METLRGALIYLYRTGSDTDGQKALAWLTLVWIDRTHPGREGGMCSNLAIGELARCIYYTYQAISVGPLR